ncbi:hypothetical protein QWZ06_03820 [Chryseobacterium tructae]|uniref:Uncharacterized protein n=1 Tax=Chryseobacterium tructae TaxID=1037380 RepID=A0ABV7XVD7_9FLAO|nr:MULTISPECIES: hypothetical protein [Chryseobacterium]MDN3691443.1 hypothetical protein [Chryseobacterium tructae]
MKKLSRTKLKDIKGQQMSGCARCSTSGNYGDGPEYTYGCMSFWGLSPECRNCVDVSADCYGPDYSDYYNH